MKEARINKAISSQREFLDDIQSVRSELFTVRMVLQAVLEQTGGVKIRGFFGMEKGAAQELVDIFPRLEIIFNDRLISHTSHPDQMILREQ